VDCDTRRGVGPRAVGEIVVDPTPALRPAAPGGYRNPARGTTAGSPTAPAGRVRHGVGNGDGSGTDGVWMGRVFGTYLHGPVLARNPALADLLLTWVVGDLARLDDGERTELRRERVGT